MPDYNFATQRQNSLQTPKEQKQENRRSYLFSTMAPAPTNPPSDSKPTLSASYCSPVSPTSRSFQHQVAAPLDAEGSVAAKKAYLSELRGLVTLVQSEINVFLTERMEEDKKAAEAQGRQDTDRDAKEEDNYGEENVEEDDD